MTNEMTIRKRASDAEQKLLNNAKAGKVSLRKFKREYPHGARSDYKAIQKREKEIGATNKAVFEASEKPVKKRRKRQRQRPPRRKPSRCLGQIPTSKTICSAPINSGLTILPILLRRASGCLIHRGFSRAWPALGFDFGYEETLASALGFFGIASVRLRAFFGLGRASVLDWFCGGCFG